MGWTYSFVYDGTAAGLRNQVRLRLGDTDTARQLLADEEIAYLLAANGNGIVQTVIDGARAVIARFATRPDSQTVGGVSIAWSGILARMQALIAQYTAALSTGGLPYAGGISIADMDARDADTDRPTPVFDDNIHRVSGAYPEADEDDEDEDG